MSQCAHVPMRTCLGCGSVAPQRDMLRIARDRAGGLGVDRQRRLGGRGGYLHPHPVCWDGFARRKGPVRSLRVAVDRPARAALVAQLRQLGLSEG